MHLQHVCVILGPLNKSTQGENVPEKPTQVPGEYLELLRKNGGRVTPIVSALLQRLHKSKRVYTPEQIKDELDTTLHCDIGFPTIYRAIDRLLRCRLLYRMHRGDGQTMFFLCCHPEDEHHHHFICTVCKRVFEIEMCMAHQYESHVAKYLGATITRHIIQLEGMCKDCLSDNVPKRRKQ
ncbi:MAG: hypothetical protein GF398_19695 [Chitinivibrionales bacterium]|nr:hypothetical protein [Chitinivibrionales bacterium]